MIVCRTGYTGERGYELVPRWDDAAALWDAVLAAGEPAGIRPCGLGARDTLRTEMGYPLHGQDLSLDITPVQARCGWAVGWKKPAFWGRDVLLAEQAGRRRAGCCGGCEALERGIPRPHMTVRRRRRRRGRRGHQRHVLADRASSASRWPCSTGRCGRGREVPVDVRGRPAAVPGRQAAVRHAVDQAPRSASPAGSYRVDRP